MNIFLSTIMHVIGCPTFPKTGSFWNPYGRYGFEENYGINVMSNNM